MEVEDSKRLMVERRVLCEMVNTTLEFKRILEHLFEDKALLKREPMVEKYRHHFYHNLKKYHLYRRVFNNRLCNMIENLDKKHLSQCDHQLCTLPTCGKMLFDDINFSGAKDKPEENINSECNDEDDSQVIPNKRARRQSFEDSIQSNEVEENTIDEQINNNQQNSTENNTTAMEVYEEDSSNNVSNNSCEKDKDLETAMVNGVEQPEPNLENLHNFSNVTSNKNDNSQLSSVSSDKEIQQSLSTSNLTTKNNSSTSLIITSTNQPSTSTPNISKKVLIKKEIDEDTEEIVTSTPTRMSISMSSTVKSLPNKQASSECSTTISDMSLPSSSNSNRNHVGNPPKNSKQNLLNNSSESSDLVVNPNLSSPSSSHSQTNKNSEEAGNVTAFIKCRVNNCSYVFHDLKVANKHYKEKHAKLFKCSVCSELFSSKYLVYRHFEVHESGVNKRSFGSVMTNSNRKI